MEYKLIRLRNGSLAGLKGKGTLGRVLVGVTDTGKTICWNLDGCWRWDGMIHPLDIVEGYTQ